MAVVNINRETFSHSLAAVAAVVNRSQTMPVLENVLITQEDGQAFMTAQDSDLQITAQLDDLHGDADFALTVNARELLSAVNVAPDEAMDMTVDENRIRMHSGSMAVKFNTLPAAAFPRMQQERLNDAVTLPQGILHRMLSRTFHAMAVHDTRIYLNGTLFDIAPDRLTLVATDGYRLGSQSIPLNQLSGTGQLLVPRKTVLTLLRLLGNSADPLTIEFGLRSIAFTFGPYRILSRLIDAQFPAWQRIVPSGHPILIEVERKRLLDAAKRASVIGTAAGAIRMLLSDTGLRVSGANKDAEEVSDEIGLSAIPGEVEFTLSPKFLIEVLSELDEDLVCLALGLPEKAMKLTLPGEADYLYLIMPMRPDR